MQLLYIGSAVSSCLQCILPHLIKDTLYLTLPYHMGKTFYRLALRPLTGPMHIPELTIRLQNPQVQYSPGSIPIPETIPLPRGGLLTWTYLLICTLGISKRISARKHINTSILITMTRKTPNQKTRVPSPRTPCISSALLCNPECLLQAHPVCYQHDFVTQSAFTKHTLYNNSVTL